MTPRFRLNPLPTFAATALLAAGNALAQNAAVTWLEVEDGQGWDAIPGLNRWQGACPHAPHAVYVNVKVKCQCHTSSLR